MVLRVGGLVLRVAGPPRLALARVQQLEDARDVLGVRADHVALRHRAHVEHFAATFKLKIVHIISILYRIYKVVFYNIMYY